MKMNSYMRGFTLIELLVVIAIIAILAAMVLTFGIGLRHDSNAQDGLSKPPSADAQGEKTDISAIDANASSPKIEPEIKVTDVELLASKLPSPA